MLRSMPAEYGYELNEFDPYFNYRATEYLVENGYGAYKEWHDDMSWYPDGRDVSATSQTGLHFTAAALYSAFGSGMSIYDFTILFPAVIGSLTVLLIFALVRVIGGTSAGLLSAILFSVSFPIIVRGSIGWFKSEPLGLFYGILGVYLLLSAIKANNAKIAAAKLVGGGMSLAAGLGSWGGDHFFVLVLGVFFLALPFLNGDRRFQLWAIPLFTASLLGTILFFERPGISFVAGIGGLSLVGPTIFLVAYNLVRIFSSEKKAFRNSLLLFAGTIASGAIVLTTAFSGAFLHVPSFRYLNSINPFLTTINPLTDSISEHATTTIAQSFFFHSVWMIFAGIGIWIILSRVGSHQRNDMYGFALIFGILGVYISSAFVRLEVFASIAIIILSSVGIPIMIRKIFEKPRQTKWGLVRDRHVPKLTFCAGIIILLVIPLLVPENSNWINEHNDPPTILNGATQYHEVFPDWPATLSWIKENTPEDAVIASWWDYGYWITTVGERTTLADNATIDRKQITKIAKVLLSSPDEAWQTLQEIGADYVLVFVVANLVTTDNDVPLYTLSGGGDESKKVWFMKIAGEPPLKYLHGDLMSGTPYFWNETLLGNLFPYTVVTYYNQQNMLQFDSHVQGTIPIYAKDIKFQHGNEGPFELVYASPSYLSDTASVSLGVLIYELNKDYDPASEI